MSYLIDTNVISELVKPKPDKNVITWFDSIPGEDIYLSVLTLGEIRKGIEKVSDKSRKEKLRIWLEHELPGWFGDRILSIDKQIVDCWGRIQAHTRHSLPAIDSLIAATAISFNLALVTRNVADFKFETLEVINPWN